jgi:hypothetical protein
MYLFAMLARASVTGEQVSPGEPRLARSRRPRRNIARRRRHVSAPPHETGRTRQQAKQVWVLKRQVLAETYLTPDKIAVVAERLVEVLRTMP